MSAALIYPLKLLREDSHDWNIVGNTQGAGQTSSTPSVDIRSDGGGFWMAALNEIQFWDQADALLWRAVRQLCNGGVVPIAVPRNDAICAPFPPGSRSPLLSHFDDAATFDDGSVFSQSVIDVTVVGDTALRATSMLVRLNNCAALQGGESFSILNPTWSWRMHEIGSAVDQGGGITLITFNPPLREFTPNGTQLEFDLPRCTMKLATLGAMDLNFTTWPFSSPSVKLLESKFAT